ncbi:hypothetical protein [Microlunatus antarcticus]|uniref:Uncharacterized protein n=1 Tax=Microlunatus antarcticus TaxID=53388 RepID=A0A7W5JZ54_9ACTN|nr:hypothetical protein [Microlunatus antarcticus]MBB3328908.1 hypothetical protein [Microlunatus antarcticus]
MTDQPSTPDPQTTDPTAGDDALERAAESIREAHDAEATVAANDDITTEDRERAGEYSQSPDGEGGRP